MISRDHCIILALCFIIAMILLTKSSKDSFQNNPSSIARLEEKNLRGFDTESNSPETAQSKRDEFSKKITLRDFKRFPCKDRRRVGGLPNYLSNAPDPLWRIDGAWYVCFDEFVKPTVGSCLVYSFDTDESFDLKMNQKNGCNVYSFDPFIESPRFTAIRRSSRKLRKAFEIKVNEKWSFLSNWDTGRSVICKNTPGSQDKFVVKL